QRIYSARKFTNGNAINICLYTKREKSLDTTVSGLFLFVGKYKGLRNELDGCPQNARKKSCGLFKMRASYE
ncbi:hypothetical protein, partial [Bacillus wiedmannii]|uniref:hypothetical protein n=1 Tax=Bacillus wiedmannii TaxID=1890302 RepID=UPI001C54D86C